MGEGSRSQRPAAADPAAAAARPALDDTPGGPAQGKTLTVTLRIEWCVLVSRRFPTDAWLARAERARTDEHGPIISQHSASSDPWLPALGREIQMGVSGQRPPQLMHCAGYTSHAYIPPVSASSPAALRRAERRFSLGAERVLLSATYDSGL